MRRNWTFILVALLWLQVPEVESQNVVNALPDDRGRPRIGLVLGGGGARGLAHVGVLKILEEMRVPVDCIVGTSVGALVGATYAAGASADEIEAALLEIDWGQTLGEQGLRDRTPIEEKLVAVNYTNALSLGISGGRLRGRSALVSSQNVEELLTQLVVNAQFTRDFNELPIPFRAIATDMLKGEMVVLGEGELAVAMRASMAIPGVFSPVELDGALLADGGMIRNLPVDIARGLCADVVIAVWLEWPLEDAEMQSTFGMINRALEVMIKANEKDQIATLTESDVGIAVPVGTIAVADFTRVAEAIKFGAEAGDYYRDSLARYSLPAREYSEWASDVRVSPSDAYQLGQVEIIGLDRVNPAYVESQLINIKQGATLTIAELVEDTQRIYALGDFERVEYRLSGPENSRTLSLEGSEKSWGPDFVSFDYGIANLSGADLSAIIRVDHERTWMNRSGGRWHNLLQIGRQTLMASDFYQPLDTAQRFFVRPQVSFESRLEDIYEGEDRVATYEVGELYGQLDVGANVGTHTQFSVGFRHGWQSAKVETGLQALPSLDREDDSTFEFRIIHDTRDSVSLPNGGRYFSLRYADSREWFGSDLDYSLWEGVLSRYFDLGSSSLGVMLGGADTLSGIIPVSQLIEVGGIRTFPGLRPGELRGSQYWLAGLSYSWRVIEIQPILGQALYAGLRIQAGEMQDEFYGTELEPIYGLSGSLSARTPIGPVLLSLGWAKGGRAMLQFSLGRPITEGSLFDRVQ